MGCGKTLQAAAIMASAAAEQASLGTAGDQPQDASLPSLVICPSTLVMHWAYEIGKYVDQEHLKPVPLSDKRMLQQCKLDRQSVVIMSYDSLR